MIKEERPTDGAPQSRQNSRGRDGVDWPPGINGGEAAQAVRRNDHALTGNSESPAFSTEPHISPESLGLPHISPLSVNIIKADGSLILDKLFMHYCFFRLHVRFYLSTFYAVFNNQSRNFRLNVSFDYQDGRSIPTMRI
jgi:hypothetical protein